MPGTWRRTSVGPRLTYGHGIEFKAARLACRTLKLVSARDCYRLRAPRTGLVRQEPPRLTVVLVRALCLCYRRFTGGRQPWRLVIMTPEHTPGSAARHSRSHGGGAVRIDRPLRTYRTAVRSDTDSTDTERHLLDAAGPVLISGVPQRRGLHQACGCQAALTTRVWNSEEVVFGSRPEEGEATRR